MFLSCSIKCLHEVQDRVAAFDDVFYEVSVHRLVLGFLLCQGFFFARVSSSLGFLLRQGFFFDRVSSSLGFLLRSVQSVEVSPGSFKSQGGSPVSYSLEVRLSFGQLGGQFQQTTQRYSSGRLSGVNRTTQLNSCGFASLISGMKLMVENLRV